MDKFSSKIWYEKYRASTLDELILPKNVRKNMERYIKRKEIPHLLFYGPAGSGKTTLALILIRACASAKLILNGSSEDRGIATIKKKVKLFASSKRISGDKLNIVFIDEADGLTPDAQDALKNIIETYQSNCRFIFTANEIDKITDPIYSRCTMFAFESMPTDYFLSFLYDILDEEQIGYKKTDVQDLVESIGMDVRTILNNLQAGSVSGTFKLKNVLDTFNTSKIKDLLNKGKINKIREIWNGQKDFIWFYKFMFNDYLSDKECGAGGVKTEAALILAEYLYKNKLVADKEINAVACCLELMQVFEIDVVF